MKANLVFILDIWTVMRKLTSRMQKRRTEMFIMMKRTLDHGDTDNTKLSAVSRPHIMKHSIEFQV